ncbi:MAG TPA: DUF255 domain-containing protein [Anaerolineae bacterium]|nr:DUF255 domain-containing protein [Anaerolineae bacterium]
MQALYEIPEAWRLAIQRERDAHEFYTRMAQSATDAATRSLFDMLAEQERKHEAILEAEYRKQFEPDLELGKQRLPITWYEWDDDSFDLARTLDLPVLLYITAPWCDPCHLMERAALADADVVQAINAGFLPIWVDADKRPDVDARYGKGGWPTTAFLNAEGDVLESHNYLTTDELLLALDRVSAWHERGAQAPAVQAAARLSPPVGEDAGAPEAAVVLKPDVVDEIAERVVAAYDGQHGGFGETPRFHHADVLEFALAYAHRTGSEAMSDVVHGSLAAMAGGGVHDRVAGGFFRYSTAADWSEPHYEKIADDQGRMLALYLRAYQATARPEYLSTAQGVLRYIDTVLWDRERGYAAASQEADPAYYVLDAEGRRGRSVPYIDKTAYTERNAVIASAYLLASAVLNEPRCGDLAIRALEFVWNNSYREGLGMHHYFDTAPRVPGLLSDQVSMALAWLDAFEHFGREIYLQRAETLLRFAQNALRDSDGRYFDTVAAPEAVGRLRRRTKPFRENALAAEACLRLHRLTGREEYRQSAQQTLEALVPSMPELGFQAARLALTLDRFLRKPLLITVVGENEDPLRDELLRAGRRAYSSNKTVQAVDPVWEPGRLVRLGYPAQPAPAAYVCLGTLCARPTGNPDELLAQTQAMEGGERAGRGQPWSYKGYTVEEGLKPEPRGRLQYYLRVLEGGARAFRYCIWTTEEAVRARWPEVDPSTEAGRAALEEHLRREGHGRVKAKIDAGVRKNWLLDLRASGEEEEELEERDGRD